MPGKSLRARHAMSKDLFPRRLFDATRQSENSSGFSKSNDIESRFDVADLFRLRRGTGERKLLDGLHDFAIICRMKF